MTLTLILSVHHHHSHDLPRHSGAHTVDCKPLMDAVSDLVTFASSPSFATTPAVIGEQVSVT